MRKPDDVILLTREERENLEVITRTPDTPYRVAQRACIVLLAAEGIANKAIAFKVGVSRATVVLWRKRYAQSRLEGLQDIPGRGPKPKYSEAAEHRILAMLDIHPPRGHDRWTGKLLARALGDVSPHQVWRVLRKHGIQLKWFGRLYIGEGQESTRVAAKNLSLDVKQVNPDYKLWQLFAYTYRLIDSTSGAIFRKYGLSLSTVAILSILYQTGQNFKPIEFARICRRKPNTITVILNKLEKRGLLKKTNDKYRKNAKRVSLTKKGQLVIQNVANNNLYHKIFAKLSEEKRQQFTDCLYDLLAGFGADRPPPDQAQQTENVSRLGVGTTSD
jgi:DNA-binding MarR family transcriptional regulator/transposase